ncbi:MAG: TIGR04283 family arsenosugar biosynthesis glycosyltransferase [Paracoccaceae bacterium]
MPAPLTIIIPTLNAAHKITPCLASLGEALEAGILAEVIFADGGSSDDIADIADGVGAIIVNTHKGRGGQMAMGATHARGEWLLFLHADSVLAPGWVAIARAHMQTKTTAGYFRLQFDETTLPARIVANWANMRARLFGLPYGDQGLLINRILYENIGAHPSIPLMEDVAIASTLRGQLTPLAANITTSAEKYHTQGWLRRSLRNFTLLMRYKLGADPAVLAAKYVAQAPEN